MKKTLISLGILTSAVLVIHLANKANERKYASLVNFSQEEASAVVKAELDEVPDWLKEHFEDTNVPGETCMDDIKYCPCVDDNWCPED